MTQFPGLRGCTTGLDSVHSTGLLMIKITRNNMGYHNKKLKNIDPILTGGVKRGGGEAQRAHQNVERDLLNNLQHIFL